MRLRVPVVAFAFIVTIAACSRRDPVANGANAAAALPAPVKQTAPSPAGAPPTNDTAPSSVAPAPAVAIPAAFQGRWGLTPADCTLPLSSAKGLMVVNTGEIRLYESRAVPSPGVQGDADSLTGNFQFTGEGQSWTKFESLQRQKDKLIRTESNPTASFTYAKC